MAELNVRIKKLKSEILESESKLAQCKDMEMSRQMIDELEIHKNEVSRKMSEIKYRISMQEIRKREMSDNKTLKEKTAEAQKLQDEITKLGEELVNMNHENLVKEIKNYGEKIEALNKKVGVPKFCIFVPTVLSIVRDSFIGIHLYTRVSISEKQRARISGKTRGKDRTVERGLGYEEVQICQKGFH